MERNLKDKVVVITGGAEGLGFAIADAFLQEGIKQVILVDINATEGENAMKKLTSKYGEKIKFEFSDVTKDLDLIAKKIFEKYGYVDVLVNSAGIVDENSVKKCMGVNAIALMEWSMKFHEQMSKNSGGKGGTIINISSIFGYAITPMAPIYHASKHAVLGFTKSLGHNHNYKIHGVRVFAICPGFTRTNLTSNIKSWRLDNRFRELAAIQTYQDADIVGFAAADVFGKADSGTIWEIAGGKSAEEIRIGALRGNTSEPDNSAVLIVNDIF